MLPCNVVFFKIFVVLFKDVTRAFLNKLNYWFPFKALASIQFSTIVIIHVNREMEDGWKSEIMEIEMITDRYYCLSSDYVS